jgi:hypothetical protein
MYVYIGGDASSGGVGWGGGSIYICIYVHIYTRKPIYIYMNDFNFADHMCIYIYMDMPYIYMHDIHFC